MPSLGPSLPLSPPLCLLPPAGDGPVCSQLALLWYCSVLCSRNGRVVPPAPLLSAPTCWWRMKASGGTFLLGVAFRLVICGFYLFFLPVRLPSGIQKLPPDPPVRGFPGVWKLPLLRLLSNGSLTRRISNSFVSFYLLYFVLPPFEDNGLLFWVPDVLC